MKRAIIMGLVTLHLAISGTANAALPFRFEWLAWSALQMHSMGNNLVVIGGELSRPNFDYMWLETPNHDPAACAEAVRVMGWTGDAARMPSSSVLYGQGTSAAWQDGNRCLMGPCHSWR